MRSSLSRLAASTCIALGHVQHERQDRSQVARFVQERGVVPLAEGDRAVLAVVAVRRDATRVGPVLQVARHLGHVLGVLVVDPAEVLHALAQDLFGAPAEDPFGLIRPADDPHVRPPLDHRQGRVVDVEAQPLGELSDLVLSRRRSVMSTAATRAPVTSPAASRSGSMVYSKVPGSPSTTTGNSARRPDPGLDHLPPRLDHGLEVRPTGRPRCVVLPIDARPSVARVRGRVLKPGVSLLLVDRVDGDAGLVSARRSRSSASLSASHRPHVGGDVPVARPAAQVGAVLVGHRLRTQADPAHVPGLGDDAEFEGFRCSRSGERRTARARARGRRGAPWRRGDRDWP